MLTEELGSQELTRSVSGYIDYKAGWFSLREEAKVTGTCVTY